MWFHVIAPFSSCCSTSQERTVAWCNFVFVYSTLLVCLHQMVHAGHNFFMSFSCPFRASQRAQQLLSTILYYILLQQIQPPAFGIRNRNRRSGLMCITNSVFVLGTLKKDLTKHKISPFRYRNGWVFFGFRLSSPSSLARTDPTPQHHIPRRTLLQQYCTSSGQILHQAAEGASLLWWCGINRQHIHLSSGNRSSDNCRSWRIGETSDQEKHIPTD